MTESATKIYRDALVKFQQEFWDSYYFPPKGQFNIAEMQRLDSIIIEGLIGGDAAAEQMSMSAIQPQDQVERVAEALKPFLYDLPGMDLHHRAAKAAIAIMGDASTRKDEESVGATGGTASPANHASARNAASSAFNWLWEKGRNWQTCLCAALNAYNDEIKYPGCEANGTLGNEPTSPTSGQSDDCRDAFNRWALSNLPLDSHEQFYITEGIDPSTSGKPHGSGAIRRRENMNDDILTIKVPVPVPEIKTYSRWQVFLALFDRRSHFTTCDTIQHKLALETEGSTKAMLDNLSVCKA